MAQFSTSTVEASKLLEAALEQMDGIIQGTKYDSLSHENQQHSITDDLNLHVSNLQSNYASPSPSLHRNNGELSEAMRRLHLAIQNTPSDGYMRLSLRDRDVEDSIYNWIEGRRRAEGIGGKPDSNDLRNFNYEFSAVNDQLVRMEEENRRLREEISTKSLKMLELEKTIQEGGNDTQTGCGDALNTSTTSTPSTAMQSELIQLKNRCSDLDKENLELRKLCGGNRTPKYLDLNQRYNTNMQNVQKASSPLSSSVSDHEMSPVEPQQVLLSQDISGAECGHTNTSNSSPKSTKGLRRIFSKIKRSNSGGTIGGEQNNHQQQHNSKVVIPPQPIVILPKQNMAFTRGGKFRATTGGHRFKSSAILTSTNETSVVARRPFNHWTLDMLSIWIDSLGLGMYDNHLKLSGIRNGEGLASMSGSDLESKLGIKMALHRKKLILAIVSRQETSINANVGLQTEDGLGKDIAVDSAGKLDHNWVTRWLDDIGLPQYKEAFLEARVDGRVLNVLTIDDLIFELGVGSLLHHLCIRRAIQILRQKNFDHNCLKRRSSPDENDRDVVQLWSNHRVMEWLKEVDLAEYAPNLRGSGVHGGLMVHEPRFDDILLADLLSIPSNKTLLRRHLSIHFKELVGREVLQRKRNLIQQDAVSGSPHNVPLTPTAKAKSKSRQGTTGAFTLRRKKSKSHFDYGDLVCPFASNALNTSAVGR